MSSILAYDYTRERPRRAAKETYRGPTTREAMSLAFKERRAKEAAEEAARLAEKLRIAKEKIFARDQALARLSAAILRARLTTMIRAEQIVHEVAHEMNVSYEKIMGRSRTAKIADARHEAMWRVHAELGWKDYMGRAKYGNHKDKTIWSLPRIGQLFKRDHTTVLHAIRKIDALRAKDRAAL